jgi:hypothetical protein
VASPYSVRAIMFVSDSSQHELLFLKHNKWNF